MTFTNRLLTQTQSLILSLSVAGLVSACGASSSTTGGGGDVGRTGCVAGYKDGGLATLSLLNQKAVQTTNFGKKFHVNVLESVDSASAFETTKVIRQLGVDLYKYEGSNCMVIDDLPVVSGKAKQSWDKANEGLPPNTSVLGLYIGQEKFENGKIKQVPVMIVRDDTTRWTIVHELMHFLFHKYEVEEGTPHMTLGNDAYNAKREADLILKAYEKTGSGVDYKNLMEKFDTLVRLQHESIKRGPLEESTVEDTLAERYLKGLLSFVPVGRAYDDWYLSSNLEQASAFYIKQGDATTKFKNLAKDAIIETNKEIAAVEEKLANLVVDSPQKHDEQIQLMKQKEMLVQSKQAYIESDAVIQNTRDFLVVVVNEILALSDKAKERKEKRPAVSPFEVFSKFAFQNAMIAPTPHEMHNETVCGRHFEIPSNDDLFIF